MSPERERDELSLAEAARWLGIAPRTLERWAKAGKVPSTVTAEGSRTFRRGDLLGASTTTDDVGPESH